MLEALGLSAGLEPSAEREAREVLAGLAGFGIRLGLGTESGILELLGNPQKRVPTVLVAGTNGKGSVSATLHAIASAAGWSSALYTSPHLSRVEERLRFGEFDIGRGECAGRILALRDELAGTALTPTYFEFLTALAYAACAERGVDLAVFEVGLGGRHDATNAGDPLLAVVTSIGRDHTQQLGERLDDIAYQKGGIARPGRPLLTSESALEPLAGLRRASAEVGAVLTELCREVRWEARDNPRDWTSNPPRQRLRVVTARASYDLCSPLVGDHQRGNLALAVRAAELTAEALGRPLSTDAVEAGVAATRWPGRLEALVWNAAKSGRIWLDGAHNPAAAERLAGFADVCGWPGSIDLLFAVMRDKDIEGIAAPLFARARRIVATRPAGSERALEPEAIAALARRHGRPASAFESVPEALAELAAGSTPDSVAIAAGSLYLVGEVRDLVLAGAENHAG